MLTRGLLRMGWVIWCVLNLELAADPSKAETKVTWVGITLKAKDGPQPGNSVTMGRRWWLDFAIKGQYGT
jgi:hypothetical protein